MDIVEFLRSVEWMCHSNMRGLMENDRPYEAADEIERLRKTLRQIADVSERWEDSLVSQINEMAHKALKEKK